MTIKFKCRCGRVLKAANQHAGKHGKCPTCGLRVTIPTIALPRVVKQDLIAPEIVEETRQWHVQTEDGESYGPTSKSVLDTWVQERRVDSSCQVLREGWDQWKWAKEVYPELAQSRRRAEEQCQDPNSEPRKLCARAAQLRQESQEGENVLKAENVFRDALLRFPGFWMSHFGLGELLLLKASHSDTGSGPTLDEGLNELQRAAALAPSQPEPPLKLARHLATTDIDAAAGYYEQALKALRGEAESLYPVRWQASDHWGFAIGAAENGYWDLAVDAFCRAIQINDDFAGTYMPSGDTANDAWQAALRKLGKTKWFDEQVQRDQMWRDFGLFS